ncbi:MAG: 23S rRNA (guanosine(2251)-2'-O)-methyltransferase RlmB [Bdellovibrionales bacterium]|nr:23S rRNA (guanosine(2251)-2'-O)-methyltransferase RlmB [Bdellovibrionales bacterium]
MSDLFTVKNPHSILAALKARPRDVMEIVLPRDKSDDVWDQIIAVAGRARVKTGEAGGRDQRGGRGDSKPAAKLLGRESAHGALIKPKQPTSIEKMFEGIDQNTRGVWLALDTVQDPQNLGAIFRSASFFDIKGIVMTSERSAPVTATVYDISSGGVETVPFAPVINLQRAFEKAKEAGLWILGTSEHAKDPLREIKSDRPWLLVMGNEENGLRRLTLEACDVTCGIPPVGNGVTSLNVSVATGILLAHLT